MFRKYPYWGLLLLSLLCWLAAWYSNDLHHAKFKPANIAAAVKQRLSENDAVVCSFLRDEVKVNKVLNGRPDDKLFNELSLSPFYLFAYYGDSLVYWNKDDVLSETEHIEDTIGHLVNLNNQYCIKKVFLYPQQSGPLKSLVFLQTVAYQYSFDNEYLHSYLQAAPYITSGVTILDRADEDTYDINDASGRKYLFSLDIIPDEGDSVLPTSQTVALTLVAVFLSFLWFQLLILFWSRSRGWGWGVLLTATLLLLLRTLLFYAPLPFHLKELSVFSPDIYAASKLLPSLGDLLLNELCIMWFLVFALMETPYRDYLKNLQNKIVKIGLFCVLVLLLLYVNYEAWGILRSLVIDSQILFNVSHLHSVDEHTIMGLLSIAAGLMTAEMLVRLINAQLRRLLPGRWIKQLIIAGLGIAVIFVFQSGRALDFISVFWLSGYIFLLDIRSTRTFSNILSVQMIFVSLFTCTCVTVKLHYLIKARDIDKDRVAFASHLLAQQDPQMEYTFKSVKGSLRKDQSINQFFKRPTPLRRAELVKWLNLIHLDVLLNRYETDYYFFDSTWTPLYNSDTLGYVSMSEIYGQGMPTLDGNLVFNALNGNNSYLSRIKFEDTIHYIGCMFIRITPRQTVNEMVYPELLQPAHINKNDGQGKYNYAIYANGRLISQTSEYTFPFNIDENRPPGAIVTQKPGDIYELYYKEAPGKSVIIAGKSKSWSSTGVLMSYLFGLHLFLSMIGLTYRGLFRMLLRYHLPEYHFTLSRRIHFSMQSIVLISFCIVGVVTVLFFERRYQTARQATEYQTTQTINRFVKQNLTSFGGMKNIAAMDSVAQGTDFQYAMANIAANQKIDANIFSRNGKLLLATQEDIYMEGLLAPIMNPKAFRQLDNSGPVVEIAEFVGSFHFISCYTPIKNDEGTTLGYISVPFFSSDKDLSDQISNIIVALINIYALLFLLSSLLGLFITSRITRTFNLLIGKFEQLTLQKNELIEWPYNDEIGTLVREYNNMARKVEENATLLAQSEREGAWREMAKQVAHEIKNPLTPMKLNIQYLQNALKNKHPQVEELAVRVSNSIIEQIDNLSYIASEFSNFAKMPEANPEVLVLNELVGNAVALYQNKTDIDVIFISDETEMKVLADKSQLLRVFTNLLQNAVQSIPVEERNGEIEIRLEQQEKDVIFSIKDNGMGIPDEIAERIFKPYFTTKSSGTGLGLAMTRKIIELWKGSIWFESVAEKGTTFFIRLPLTE